MLRLDIKAGAPIFEQVLYAARKAIITGELKPGDDFPSVRSLSQQFRINPNTVQKALTELKHEGLVETIPGVGNRVCEARPLRTREIEQLLAADVEALALRARQHGLSLEDFTALLHKHWNKLSP